MRRLGSNDIEAARTELQLLLVSFHFANCLQGKSDSYRSNEKWKLAWFEASLKSLSAICIRVDRKMQNRLKILEVVSSSAHSLVGVVDLEAFDVKDDDSRKAAELRRIILTVKSLSDLKSQYLLADGVKFEPKIWPNSLVNDLSVLFGLIEARLRVLAES